MRYTVPLAGTKQASITASGLSCAATGAPGINKSPTVTSDDRSPGKDPIENGE